MQKKIIFTLMAGMGLICLATGVLASPPFSGQLPYTGIIINKSSNDVSFPSQNSGATLIVPAGSSLEYIAWSTDFDLLGYVAGQPSFCQQIKIGSVRFPYRGKAYSFGVEIQPDRPLPVRHPLRPKPRFVPKPSKG